MSNYRESGHSVYGTSILSDLEAGEEPMMLSKAVRDSRLCINGRPHDVSWAFRAAIRGCKGASGERVILETITQAGKRITTRSAIGRFIAAQAGVLPAKVTAAANSESQAAKRRLAAAGM